MPELLTIASHIDRDEFESRIIRLAGRLDDVALDKLARAVKDALSTGITSFKSAARNYASESGDDHERELPPIYFDGTKYFRPLNKSYVSICREDAFLELRAKGFSSRLTEGAELSPLEIAIHKIQTENRVHFAGPLCGRPTGIHKEGTISVLSTRGPCIIEGSPGDHTPITAFLCGLFGKGHDPLFNDQLFTLLGWLRHFRTALKNHEQHMPGQALALVGARDCGKSLLQSLITMMSGRRQVDASLWLLGDSSFNKELWSAEHLIMGDDAMGDDGRERHGVRDRLKKLTVANIFPLHAKGRDAESFRPLWRVSISANDDDQSITVLPPLDESFSDKIIYLRCYPPQHPFHDGTEDARREFWQRLVSAIPAFIHELESVAIPDRYLGSSRFYVREFHHPGVIELISGADPVAPLGELIHDWMSDEGLREVENTASGILDQLTMWATESRIRQYTKSARHFGHQISRLKSLPGWDARIFKVTVRIGGRERNQPVNR